ncbi:hypothetical protein Q3O59_14070 [Alkalimonas delamerensis]|uniref:Uncharacterized protein n=1 Tax=Alkalimonas delamerensis TaxID=265981 RepID=A0ABT9GT50_9GAMM|nr:hypothetical protein [Alkalimonas delamerensis]MDP4530151.1 hypothetical protein [Alkalimonas delamerensis]
MSYKPALVQQIDGHQVEVRLNGLTGRETVLVDGEVKINRLNWTMNSNYLVELNPGKHIRIRIEPGLMNTIKVEFMRGGALLSQQEIVLFEGADQKQLAEPENAAWLAELKLPFVLTLLIPLAMMVALLLFDARNVLVPLLSLAALCLLCLFWLFKPPLAANKPSSSSPLSYLGHTLPRALVLGMSFGGTVGYSVAVLSDSIGRLLGSA